MGWSEYHGSSHLGFSALVWTAQILYVICFIPQIAENFNRQSERGLSDFLLIGNMNIYLALIFDVFCNGYPYPYKITAILQFFGSVALVCQSFYYDFSRIRAKKMMLCYGANFLVVLACIPLAMRYTQEVGEFCAWFLLLLFSVSFIPQAFKIYRSKSVQGFSFSFITLFAMANFIEYILWGLLDLPLPYMLYTVQNLIMYGVFCVQFFLYTKKDKA